MRFETVSAAMSALEKIRKDVPGGVLTSQILQKILSGTKDKPKDIIKGLCKIGYLREAGYGRHKLTGAQMKLYRYNAKGDTNGTTTEDGAIGAGDEAIPVELGGAGEDAVGASTHGGNPDESSQSLP